MPHTEAKHYGYEFLQDINKHYKLYGNGNQRVIIPTNGIGEVIAYIISGVEIIHQSWNEVKRNHPMYSSIDDKVEAVSR